MILLDTHVLVWLDAGDPKLGQETLLLLNKSLGEGNLFVSAISFWEVAMLVEKGRLGLQMELDVWRKELLFNGLVEIPFSGSIGIRAGQLADFHGDPADRMIVATALENSAALVTADEKILKWQKLSHRFDARV